MKLVSFILYTTLSLIVAKAVVERGCHTLGGCELEVSLYIPPKPIPCYDNKVLIKGLSPRTTQDILFNFIEAKTDFAPESMVYHSQQKDIVMVTMKQHSDFKYEILKKVLASSKLEGSRLTLAKVPISKRIMVSNLVDGVTRDTVEYYFENKRRSGGGSVTKVVMIDDYACFVYFEDYKTIDSVLKRHHSLGGKQLSVQVFPDCLDLPEGGTGERKLKVPDHLVLKYVDSKKLKFMNNSKITRCMIEQRLKTVHTKIIWPKETGDIVLECILTKQDKNCFKLVKTWKIDAENSFDDFMRNIVVHKIDVSQELWPRVIEQLININSKPEAAAVFVEKKEGMITVVGNTPVADPIATVVHEIKRKAMNIELERERQTMREVVNALKPIEMKMLVCDEYPSKMEEEFGGLKVKINLNRNSVVFEGPPSHVVNAKLYMYQIKYCCEYKTIKNISKQKQTLYQSRQTKEFIVKKLKNKNVTAVWEVQQSGSLVICLKRENLEESVSIICESVKEKSITLRGASQSVMNSEQWTCKLVKLHGLYQGKCQIDVSEDTAEIYICATDDILDEIVDSVEKILHFNTVLEEVSCSRNAHRLIERHHKDALTKISNDLKSSYVRVTSLADYGGFEVRGTGAGVEIAKKGLVQLLNKIKKREHSMEMLGLTYYMKTPKGKDSINTIETVLPCVVTLKGDGSETHSDVSMYERVPADSGVSENVGVKGLSLGDIWRKLKKQIEPIHAEPKEKKSHDIVTFIILAISEDIIDKAVEKLKRFIEKEVHIKKFEESAIKNMDDNQLMEIKAIAEQHHIRLNLDAKKGSIEIAGIPNNVISASDKIHRIIRDAITFEQQQNPADLPSNIAQWFYIEIEGCFEKLHHYEKNLNYKIENSYNIGRPNVTFTTEDKVVFKLDFGKMEEYVVDDPNDKVSVIRRDLSKHDSSGVLKPPATWDDMTGTLKVVALQSGSPEYQDITQKFTISSGGSFNISKIERIQNKTLWHQYQAKKKQLEDQNPQGTQNERLLWHGTVPDAVKNINTYGFNRSFCGKNATAFGDGVYFAVNANVSCSNTYSPPDASGLKGVYYCRVLTGEYTRGQVGMRIPPQKTGGASCVLFDSVVDNPSEPRMLIIFNDNQAYPEYFLSFKK